MTVTPDSTPHEIGSVGANVAAPTARPEADAHRDQAETSHQAPTGGVTSPTDRTPHLAPQGVQVYEVPIEASMEGLARAFEISVPTERGEWCIVDVLHNLVRRTYEIEISEEIIDQAPQAVTATVQLVMLAVRGEIARA